MKFPTGHKISEEVYQAIRFVTKIGVMSRATWYALFGTGSLRWKQKQLQRLIKIGVFKRHPCTHVEDVMSLGEFGKKLIHAKNWNQVPTVPAQFIEHDETVANGIWKLEKANICKKWMTDKELKSSNDQNFKLNIKSNGEKYPDIVFLMNGKDGNKIVAVEYERFAKTNWRYNKAIKAYGDTSKFDFILYVVESSGIEIAVKRAMKFIGDTHLNSKIGFISVNDWKSNPVTAPIRGNLILKSLKEAVYEIETKVA